MAATEQYVALVRGINVGGKNLIPMSELRTAFEDAGFGSVATYIQSGNVLFETARPASELEEAVERLLEGRFHVPLVVCVRSHSQLRDVVTTAPAGFGAEPGTYHSDVIFLRAPLTPATAMEVVVEREGVDRAWPGRGVLYFQRLSELRTQSRMSRIVGTPAYQRMTIRNWATTTKLLGLLEDRGVR
jgi:uncharacterized protein (DUF1697 family)